jgi:hypothetical protein
MLALSSHGIEKRQSKSGRLDSKLAKPQVRRTNTGHDTWDAQLTETQPTLQYVHSVATAALLLQAVSVGSSHRNIES